MVRFCADRKTEDWDVGREMKGWGLGERLALPPYDDDSGDDLSDESRCKESLNFVTPFVSSVMMRLSICPSSPRRKSVSKVREHSAVIKRATAQWHAWWSSKDRGSKSNWQRSVIEDARQSSKDPWISAKSQGKRKDVPHNVEELGTRVKEKKNTLAKSWEQSQNMHHVGKYG